MAYEKQTWKTGDVVTSAKLNHMEDGIASGGVMVVHSTYDESTGTETLDKTWQEILNAHTSGGCVIHETVTGPAGAANFYFIVDKVSSGPMPDGSISYGVANIDYTYTCASPNDYPSVAVQ